ncbi:MAG TPA: chromosome segregation protein SMC [Polyangia bacterium]|jgi:hypothetical protein
MPQLELLPRLTATLRPDTGRTEPRLWIRRLVVWSEPSVVLRDVSLRPGLNIVWSPDPSDGEMSGVVPGTVGHGSGKTLFCRLLRYCLGEERFAPDGQRERIATTFKSGMVGAEVVVDGTAWAVVRSIGTSRRHCAKANADLDGLAASHDDDADLEAFRDALDTCALSGEVSPLMPVTRSRAAWLVALAWLSRDQECRFGDALAWRAASAGSGSPARGLSASDALEVVRALIGGIAAEEHALRAEIDRLTRQHSDGAKEVTHREWEVAQKRARLASAAGLRLDELPEDALATPALRQAARARLGRVAVVGSGANTADVPTLRVAWEEAHGVEIALARELAQIDASLPVLERLVNLIRSELPGLSFSKQQAERPVCPVCEVPIDRALAEGCKLSHKLPSPAEARQRWDERVAELDKESRNLEETRANRSRVAADLDGARQRTESLRAQLRAAEKAQDARTEAWYSARRLMDDVNRLEELGEARDGAAARVGELDGKMKEMREQVAAHRDARAPVFTRVSELFDAVIDKIIGEPARGRATLDGNGMHLVVDLGGERSTPAMDSIKVLAFDLAVMCMSIEGTTHLPAFLLHDSPREADLGLTPYSRLFHFARSLEDAGEAPLFQYIITTTTRPPDELCMEPWLRLTLRGSPADGRLLRCDL